MNNPIDEARQVAIGAEGEREAYLARGGETWTAWQTAAWLRERGYDASEGTIHELMRKGYVGLPDAEAIIPAELSAIMAALECRRRWLPYPNPHHDAKKSGARLLLEQMQHAGNPAPVHDLEKFTVEDLLIRMAQSDHRGQREAIHEALRLKLLGMEE